MKSTANIKSEMKSQDPNTHYPGLYDAKQLNLGLFS